MNNSKNYLAFDLGAESGRAVLGRFDGQRLALQEIHRFPNGPVRVQDSLYWNVLNLFAELKNGLAQAVHQAEGELAALGLDTWGVDYGLLDRRGELIGQPYHYRDRRTEGMVERACQRLPRAEIFGQTGIQFMPLNTLIQLLAMVEQQAPALEMADTLLMMPDLFNFWLTGRKVSEYTIASTSQCLNMTSGAWATDLLQKLGIPTGIWPEIIQPGSRLGPILPAVVAEIGLQTRLEVIAPGSHDTASAVAAVPVAEAQQANYAYISSGTWSLVGMELKAPIINDQALAFNFTNEGGVENTIRLLKNIGGLWLVQESRRTWAKAGQAYDYGQLTELAAQATPFTALIDPDDPSFALPGDMPARIGDFCRRSGQAVPAGHGQVIRCALESLALKYRWVIEKAVALTGQKVEVLHIVGGGSQNRLLNQFAANATGLPVVTGPVEATAIGNILLQMLALGDLASLSEGRALLRNSFPVETYEPQQDQAWQAAYRRFLDLI